MLTTRQLKRYARMYEERYPTDIGSEAAFFKWFKQHRYLDKKTFVTLGRWKTRRQMHNYVRNADSFVRSVTRKALRSTDERVRIETLMRLRGVSWAVASVILHFAFPGRYPILDFRAVWSLGFRQPSTYTFEFWERYVIAFQKVAKQSRLDARSVDRALWMYSKLHQK